MSAENGLTSPEANERLYLNQLEIAYNEGLRQANTFACMPRSSLEIAAFINIMHQWEDYFGSYQPISQYLLDAGLSQMSKRLLAITQELERAIDIYNQMYKDRLACEQKQGLILQQTLDEIMNDYKNMFDNRPKFPI